MFRKRRTPDSLFWSSFASNTHPAKVRLAPPQPLHRRAHNPHRTCAGLHATIGSALGGRIVPEHGCRGVPGLTLSGEMRKRRLIEEG